MELLTDLSPIESVQVDGIIIGVYKDGGNTSGAISRIKERIGDILELDDFSGRSKETLILYDVPEIAARRVILVGLGDYDDADHEKVRLAAALGCKKLRKLRVKSIAIEALHNDGQSTAEGVLLGLYRFDNYKTPDEEKLKTIDRVTFVGNDDQIFEWNRGQVIAESQIFSRELAETPANIATPIYFTKKTLTEFNGLENVTINIRDEEWAKSMKMGAFLSVTAGTVQPAKFMEIHYSGGAPDAKPIVFVGKGITFDTGGISIKTNAGMQWMKADCTGAAVVIGTLLACAKLKLPFNVIGLTPLTENMPSGNATKPTDLVFAMNNKSIEINNTDAEGRLILSDGLVYAEQFDPDTIIDVATLTGGIMVALGPYYCGVFSRSDKLWKELKTAGDKTHEKFWRMPLDEGYKKSLKSNVADIKNSGESYGAAAIGAIFLSEFVEHNRWAHIDIAGVTKSKKTEYLPDGVSAIPMRALVQFVIDYSNAR